MNQASIEQLGRALDAVFGRPGCAQIALANIHLINMLAKAVEEFNAKQQAAQAETGDEDNG